MTLARVSPTLTECEERATLCSKMFSERPLGLPKPLPVLPQVAPTLGSTLRRPSGCSLEWRLARLLALWSRIGA
jgi:hypothetical protein